MTGTVVPLAACQITGKQILDREASKSKSQSPGAVRRNLPASRVSIAIARSQFSLRNLTTVWCSRSRAETGRYQDRIIVVGDIGASVSRVVIVSVDTGAATDSFDAFNPAVSPDRRFIAFVKFYPPHGATGTEDHHMLYDMTKSAVANRPAGVRLENRFDVGLNVYPGNGNKKDDNIGVPDWLSHQSPSLIFWSPDSTK